MKFLWFGKGHLLIQATGGTIDKLLLDFCAMFLALWLKSANKAC